MRYSEQLAGFAFNWFEFLNDCLRGTDSISEGIVLRAGSWVTCAVGNQCDKIQRDIDGEPYDNELARLGVDFYYVIRDAHYLSPKQEHLTALQKDLILVAINTLHKIEARSAQILSEMEK